MAMKDEMAQRLAHLNLQVFEFVDESHKHIGHAGNKGGGHYAVLLVSEVFEGLSRIQRQRTVQDLLVDLFASKQIHALSIKAKTPSEYFH